MTMEEVLLWQQLRRQARGYRFRRQFPIGPYFIDFACLSVKLAIEVDGGQHGGGYDQRRDQFVQSQGWTVLRVWNSDVRENLSGVIAEVDRLLKELGDAR